jgi:hypothetical protein
MRSRTIRSPMAAAMLAVFALSGTVQLAQAAEGARSNSEAAQLAMGQLRERLELTPDQEARIAPLVQARNQKLKALRDSMDAGASRREKRGALKQARAIQSEFVSKVEPLLTDPQKKEWEAIRQEMRDEMMKRYRNR